VPNNEQQRKAGKKGGATTRKRHGKEHFSSAGRKGGAATMAEHGAEHFKAAGKRGGAVMANRPEDLSRAGRKGGQATLEKLGKGHLLKLSLASKEERAARKVLPRLLAALEPFRAYLEETEGDFQRMQPRGMAAEKTSAPLHPASCGVTFGACLNLLEQLRLAKGDATVRAVGTVADFTGLKEVVQEPHPPALTVELDPEALASRGE
jgi:general stress protein YciG